MINRHIRPPTVHRRFLSGIALLATLMVTTAWARAPFPPPPDARVTPLGDSQQALGMRLEIRRFETDDSVDRVLAFYRRLWKGKAAESEMPPWRLIGRLQDGLYYNVQVQPRAGRGAWGFLSIGDLPRQARNRSYRIPEAGDIPRLSGSRVLDTQVSRDPHKTARTLSLTNRFSVARNLTYYRNHYLGQGWALEMDEATAGRKAHVLRFRRGNEQVTLAIHRDADHTTVVANHVRERALP